MLLNCKSIKSIVDNWQSSNERQETRICTSNKGEICRCTVGDRYIRGFCPSASQPFNEPITKHAEVDCTPFTRTEFVILFYSEQEQYLHRRLSGQRVCDLERPRSAAVLGDCGIGCCGWSRVHPLDSDRIARPLVRSVAVGDRSFAVRVARGVCPFARSVMLLVTRLS